MMPDWYYVHILDHPQLLVLLLSTDMFWLFGLYVVFVFINLLSDLKAEIMVRKKALQDPNFPSQDVIDEYLNHEEEEILTYVWFRPNLHKFLVM